MGDSGDGLLPLPLLLSLENGFFVSLCLGDDIDASVVGCRLVPQKELNSQVSSRAKYAHTYFNNLTVHVRAENQLLKKIRRE